jgi:hypothetical protein
MSEHASGCLEDARELWERRVCLEPVSKNLRGELKLLDRERQRQPHRGGVQSFTGAEALTYATVINGGHNWPGPTIIGNPPVASHFDAPQAILDFWHANAGLP